MKKPLLLFAILVCANAFSNNANAQDQMCPAAGTRFRLNNVMVDEIVVSIGGPVGLTGCSFRGPNGDIYWKQPNSPTLTPVGAGNDARTDSQAAQPSQTPIGSTPIPGVYQCSTPMSIGGMIYAQPEPGNTFGIINGTTYRDYNGARGTYAFSGGTLRMTSGPLRGIRYRAMGNNRFMPIMANGSVAPNLSCALNRNISINRARL